jgi:hypothetical protein
MDRPKSIHDAVAATLDDMGLCDDSGSLTRTILLRDRHFVGQKYRFDGGYAAWIAATNMIEIYGDNGKLLKTVALAQSKEAA